MSTSKPRVSTREKKRPEKYEEFLVKYAGKSGYPDKDVPNLVPDTEADSEAEMENDQMSDREEEIDELQHEEYKEEEEEAQDEKPQVEPEEQQPTEVPVDPTLGFLLEQRKLFIETLVKTEAKVKIEIEKIGSRTRVQRLVLRMGEDYNQLRDTLRKIGEAQPMHGKTVVKEMQVYRDVVANSEDAVDEYLDSRKDDAPSELTYCSSRSGKVKVDPVTGGTIGKRRNSVKVTVQEDEKRMMIEEEVEESSEDSASTTSRAQAAKIKARVATLRVEQEKDQYQIQQKIEHLNHSLQQTRIADERRRAEFESKLWQEEMLVKKKPSSVSSESLCSAGERPRNYAPIATSVRHKLVRPRHGVDDCSEVDGEEVRKRPLEKIVDSLPKVKPRRLFSTPQEERRPEDAEQLRRFFQGMAKPQLPKFSGNRARYFDWKSEFQVFIDDSDIPVKFKMKMLKDALSGRALDLVEGLGYSQAGYEMAFFKLDSRYGGEKRDVQRHIDLLITMPAVEEDDLEGLEKLASKLCDMTARLGETGQTTELIGYSTLYSLTCQKVPDSLLILYRNTLSSRTRDRDGLAAFTEWFNDQVNVRIELSELKAPLVAKKPTSYKNPKNGQGKSYAHQTSTSANGPVSNAPVSTGNASTPAKEMPQKTRFVCPLCGDPHHIVKCKQWTTMNNQQRWDVAKDKNLCFRCLCSRHSRGATCANERQCGIDNCSRTHHRHLHRKIEKPGLPANDSSSAFGVGADGTVHPRSVALRIIPVMLADSAGQMHQVNALLDDGSDSSYLSQAMAAALKLSVEENVLNLHTLTATERTVPSGLAVIEIGSVDGNLRRKIGVRTLEHLCPNLRMPNWQREKNRWPHLCEIDFPSIEVQGVVDLLVGADHPELMLALEERFGEVGDPVARLTPLGWTCVGALDDEMSTSFHGLHSSTYFTLSDRQVDESLRSLWNMDILSSDALEMQLNPEECKAMKMAVSSRIHHGDRYEIGIPWIDGRPNLPDNYFEAERRLKSLEKSLFKKPQLYDRYKEGMQQSIDKGYISLVASRRDDIPSGWYLPHFPVVREDKETTKVRIVLDSASRYKDVSLNDTMHPGPKLQREIFDILVRFRRGKVGLVGDIKEMFSQVILAEEDRRFHRILWRDLDLTGPVKIYEAQRLTFGDRASPFLAQYVLQSHARDNANQFPRASATCLESVYMDDAIDAVNTTQEGIDLREDLSTLLRGAGYVIRKWGSNDPEVLKGVPEEDLAKGILEVRDAELPSIKTLGLLWDAERDSFGFSNGIEPPASFTKRTLLSRVAKLFDPLQLLAPFTIRAKVLLQKTWILGLDWDEPLPPEVTSTALAWFQELDNVTSISVPRWYFSELSSEVSLHTFSDASGIAYAAVTYVRSVSSSGMVTVRKIAAKARVAPLRAVSIPRLELMGAVLGYRLARKLCILLNYDLNEVTFWTDSMDVVHWVRSQSRNFKTFVANRVSEVQEGTLPVQWRHVPGTENPADDATRGLPLGNMTENHRWFVGPDFLYEAASEWPKTKMSGGSEEAESEVAKSRCHTTVAEATPELMKWEKFSSWNRLVRTCVMVLRFVHLLRTAMRRRLPCVQHKVVNAEEYEKGEKLILHQVQRETFGSTIESLQNSRGAVHGPLKKLAPFLDEFGLLRVGGRLQNSELPYDVKHPVILPAKHHVTELVIRRAHVKIGHSRGINPVLAEIQTKFWIVHGREAVKKLKYNCFKCRRMHESFLEQVMAPLPSSRTLVSLRAFANVGIDFAGPFITKITRRVTAKRYVCLFTCVQTRGVHLEMVYSLDTDGFLLAFSRMVSRRGKPEKVVSDNGSNLSAGERDLKDLIDVLDQDRIVEVAAQQGIEWTFNPPYGSHHGGVFESLIKSTKRGLSATLSHAGITDEELLTALVEVEGMLNSRPLLYCSSDPDDEPVLTPNHFLLGQMGGPLAPYGTEELAYNPRQRWRFVQDLMAQFWQRWTREYLPTLQPRGKWLREKRDLVVDDVVLVADEKTPRGMWPLGRVCSTFPGKDGHVRKVEVLCRGKCYIRPITKLVLVVARHELEDTTA